MIIEPQSKEDTDIFNRFHLNGYKFIQTWGGCVYHMTCRGSRRNTLDKAKNIYEDSPEWLAQNQRSTRNFIRKWGHFVMHDPTLVPIVPPKYNVGIIIANCNTQLLELLEPWCDVIYIDEGNTPTLIKDYIEKEQINTVIDLNRRILPYDNEKNCEMLVNLDSKSFNQEDFTNIQRFSQIIQNSGEIGSFELGNLKINIIQMNEYQNELIFCPKI